MSTATSMSLPRAAPRPAAWALLCVGLLALYLPTYWAAAQGIWTSDAHGHGPLVLAATLWLAWQVRHEFARVATTPALRAGTALFIFGLGCYMIGRLFTISSLEFASQPLIVAGAVLLLKGAPALRVAWFVVFYLMFMIPLPTSLVDAATGPLKHWISVGVVDLLFWFGYPVARTGVVISVGPYQLLVADACSGLNSLVSLAALGALYIYITRRGSAWRDAVLALSILPIALAANMVRVVILVLVTYHLGDEAGQGFLHGAAGLVLMLVALGTLFLIDQIMTVLLRGRGKPDEA